MNNSQTLLAKVVWERLRPSFWPIRLSDLPPNTFLVGGCVRDALLNKLASKPDVDFIFQDNILRFLEELAQKEGGSVVILDAERQIFRLVLHGWTFDFARQVGNSLEEDLLRRDFTLNAIALTISGEPKLFDPLGGIKDINNKNIVAISQINLIEDPIRMLRAIRFICQYNFQLENRTKNFIRLNYHRIIKAKKERIKAEILKISSAEWTESYIDLIQDLDIFRFWRDQDIGSQEKNKSDYLIDNKLFTPTETYLSLPIIRLVRFLSDQGLVELGFSRRDIKLCRLLRKWQRKNDGLGFETLCEEDRLQLHIDLEQILPALIIDLPLSNQQSWLDRWRDPFDPLFHPCSPLDGFALQKALSLAPGPRLGLLMRYLTKEKAFGRLNSKQQAIDLAWSWSEQKQPFL